MNRIEAVRKLLSNNEAALIFTPVSRLYLSGFHSSLGYLFITKGEAALFVDGRYIEAAKKGVNENVEVRLFTNISEQAKEFLGDKIDTLVVETIIAVANVTTFEKQFGKKILPNSELDKELYSLRSVKTEYEIECITKAQRMAEKAFLEVLNFIREGVTEIQIAAELEYRMKLAGSKAPSFGTIVVSGEKSSMPHGVPDDKVVRAGDFITMDFGAIYKGYHSDMTRTVAVGYATDEMQKVYNTVLKANLSAFDAVREGAFIKDVDLAARNVIKQAGYGEFFTHSTGHGVGLENHETPTVSYKNENKLLSNQVITIEPGIYLEGKFGVRIEDMAVVTKNGCNNLTKAEKSLIII
ncbi:MAG: aminopeptidase P family protein [Clostridia bacterium]|nr:aminopeptidase P family protein [Clostridia bacterium]MBQ9920286.1 aminopeptidase P family protein [Clostridia bacterium]